jgi:hypothetical protein
MDVTEGERLHIDYAVPLSFHIDTGAIGDTPVVIVDLTLVVPMAPEIGEQRAVLALSGEDAVHLSEVLNEIGAAVLNQTNKADEAGEENNK